MRGLPLALVALAWNVPAEAAARRVPPAIPVVVEAASLPAVPRRPGATPDIDVGKVLIGAEAPARVDVYALTEDGQDDVPVASFDRRVEWVPLPRR